MTYSRSSALMKWRKERQAVIATLRDAHSAIGRVTGAGRPLDAGKPVAHAYVLVMAAEFQGYLRDVHDLAIDHVVATAGVSSALTPQVTVGLQHGRAMDRGNATIRNLEGDFAGLGVSRLESGLRRGDARWDPRSTIGRSDKGAYNQFIDLRNCFAHGNERQLERLRRNGVRDTVTWADGCLPMLNRMARAIDHVVWDRLRSTTGSAPW